MLKVKITSCTSCENIYNLLCDVDAKLTQYGKNNWGNISLMLCLPHDDLNVKTLIRYKNILKKKLLNPNYVCDIPFSLIVSRVKTLLNK